MARSPQARMFPNTEMNFAAGRYMPPSKNVAAQPSLFQRSDPYARNQPLGVRQALSNGTPGAVPTSTVADAARPQAQGEVSGDFAPDAYANRLLQSAAGLMPGPTGEPTPTSLDALKYLQGQMDNTPVEPTPGAPMVPPTDLEAATKLVLDAVQGNPFITPEGKSALEGGTVPQFNQINPAFYRYTSPTVVQALMGLYPQTGLFNLDDVGFYANIFTPRGL